MGDKLEQALAEEEARRRRREREEQERELDRRIEEAKKR